MPSLFGSSVAGAPCIECRRGLLGSSLRCSECGEGAHLSCSGLPRISLVRLATARASFACEACSKAKAGEKYSEVLEEIEKSLEEERANNKSIINNQTSESEEGKPSSSAAAAVSTQSTPSACPTGGDEDEINESWADQLEDGSGADGRAVGRTLVASGRRGRGESGGGTHQAQQLVTTGQAGARAVQPNVATNGKMQKERRDNICRFYKSGSCKHGNRGKGCQYAHPRKCFLYLRFGAEGARGCRGTDCEFYHPPLCRELEAGRACNRRNCRFFHRKTALTAIKREASVGTKTKVHEVPPRSSRNYAGAVRRPEARHRDYHPVEETEEVRPASGERFERWSSDFQVVRDQLQRMQRQMQYLLDLKEETTQTKCGGWNCQRDCRGQWQRSQN